MAGKKRKYKKVSSETPELNVMPFIDIFSMLNTFLLVSASFIGLGILEVQIPFFSNSPEVKDEEPSRSMSIKVEIEPEVIFLKTSWSEAPINSTTEKYTLDPEGIEKLHQELIKLRTNVPKTDKVTLFSDDDVKYDEMILVLDAIKTLKETDPDIPIEDEDSKSGPKVSGRFLYHKVTMGNVIL